MDDIEPKLSKVRVLFWLLGLIVVLALLYALYWFSLASGTEPANAEKPPQETIPSDVTIQKLPNGTNKVIAKKQPARTFVTGLEDIPRSLEGTDVDGEIIIDENKQLVVTNGLRRLFDYFLTTQGEEDLATIIARVEAYVTHRVPEPARSQVIGLFHQYLAYLQATANITQAGGKPAHMLDLDAVRLQKQQLTDLRKEYFNDKTITAFWGDETQYDNYSLSLLDIDRNKSLTAEQKAEAREKLIDELPDGHMKTQILEQKKFHTLVEETRRLKASGASPAQIRKLRVDLYGAEAADRLETLDAERATWQSRVQQYLDQRKTILAGDQTEAEKQVQVNELRYRMFTETEQKRLTAYEEIGTADIDTAVANDAAKTKLPIQ